MGGFFFYNSYLGSVDIDLVGYSMGGMFDQVIAGFERMSAGCYFLRVSRCCLRVVAVSPVSVAAFKSSWSSVIRVSSVVWAVVR